MLTLLTVIGGLALFLFGVRMLSQGMEQLAGSKLQDWLDKATNKPLKAATFGAVATGLLQSSSLLVVTMIGLINAKLLTLDQAIGVMLGQEIGTTITGQIIAFRVGDIRYVAIVLGLIFLEFAKKRNWQTYGRVLMGFGILFTGMETMSGALRPLAQTPAINSFLTEMGQDPLLGVAAGTLVTALIQSSSAMTGLIVAMGASGVINLPAAIGLIYGANIGTCFTGFLASLRATRAARRASMAQIIINIFGVLLFLPFLTPFANVIASTSTSLPRQIANAHTVFNIAVSVILFPFIKTIAKLTKWLIPRTSQPKKAKVTKFLDDHLLNVPAIALKELSREVNRMGEIVKQMVNLSALALLTGDQKAINQVLILEKNTIDPLCDANEQFVDNLIAKNLTWEERRRCFQIKNINVDLERMADHTKHIVQAAQKLKQQKLKLPKPAIRDLKKSFKHAEKMVGCALNCWDNGLKGQAVHTCDLEDEMDQLGIKLRQAQLKRIKKTKLAAKTNDVFIESLRNLERIGDHADNICVAIYRKSQT